MSNNLSKLLRYSLSGRKEHVTLQDELDHVGGYMTIQQMRYEERIQFSMSIEPSLLGCEVIPLMIQPLVENAINHALDQGVGRGVISLTAGSSNQVLTITVEDDGIGMNAEALEALRQHLRNTQELGGRSGNGLLNVHRRIVLHYGEDYGLSLESMPYQGFKAVLKLPVIHQQGRAEEDDGVA